MSTDVLLRGYVGKWDVWKKMQLPSVPRPNDLIFVNYDRVMAGLYVKSVEFHEGRDVITLSVRISLGDPDDVVARLKESGWTVEEDDETADE